MIPEKVSTILKNHDLIAMEFGPGSTPTSEMATNQIGCKVGQIAKSMLFKGKDEAFRLVVCSGDLRVNNKKLKQTFGVKARFANPKETEKVTGFRPGGVCPFGLNGIDIYIDTSLQRFETIYPAAGNDASGVPISFWKLQQVIGATVCDIMD